MAQIKFVSPQNLSRFWEKIKEKLEAVNTKLGALKLSDITDVTATAAEVNHLKGVKSAVQDQIDAKAPLASPEFTGTPTAPTAQAGTKDTTIATTAFVDAAVTAAKPDLTKYVDGAEYVKAEKKIYLRNGETNIATIDATDFIKDGMVDTVTIAAGTGDNSGKQVLKITFNTDSGKEAIEVPLEGIFNADNYYDKTAIDGKVALLATKAELESYVKSEELVAMTNDEVDAIFN